MPYQAHPQGHTNPHAGMNMNPHNMGPNRYPENRNPGGMMMGSHMNMIPVARPVQSIHGIAPKANYDTGNISANAGSTQSEREQPEFRRSATHHHLQHSSGSHPGMGHGGPQLPNGQNPSGKGSRQFPARAVMQVSTHITCVESVTSVRALFRYPLCA